MSLKVLVSLTGLTVKEVYLIASQAKSELSKFGRPKALTHLKSVLLVLVWMKLGLTELEVAKLFDVSQATAHREIHRLLPLLTVIFTAVLPEESKEHLLLDGSLIPVADHNLAAYCRIRKRAVNVQVVCDRNKKILFISEVYPGNKHDITMAKEVIPNHLTYKTDGGYRSVENCVLPPKTSSKKLYRHRKVRSRVEHVLARMKDWRVLRFCRIRGKTQVENLIKIVAGLYNLKFGFSDF
jgi:hypothetical protein